jgi:hypothetical protein
MNTEKSSGSMNLDTFLMAKAIMQFSSVAFITMQLTRYFL